MTSPEFKAIGFKFQQDLRTEMLQRLSSKTPLLVPPLLSQRMLNQNVGSNFGTRILEKKEREGDGSSWRGCVCDQAAWRWVREDGVDEDDLIRNAHVSHGPIQRPTLTINGKTRTGLRKAGATLAENGTMKQQYP
ncbi:hypothetical protein HN51_039931 [Arachis hypogaea]